MNRKELSFGSLKVTLEIEGDALHGVRLSGGGLPGDLDAVTLIRLNAEIARYRVDLSHGTAFQQRVWRALCEIPAGHVRSYAEIAREIGSPRAARAVGAACGANRLLLAVPCHRVVASKGLGGFALGLPWKRRLLELEREHGQTQAVAA